MLVLASSLPYNSRFQTRLLFWPPILGLFILVVVLFAFVFKIRVQTLIFKLIFLIITTVILKFLLKSLFLNPLLLPVLPKATTITVKLFELVLLQFDLVLLSLPYQHLFHLIFARNLYQPAPNFSGDIPMILPALKFVVFSLAPFLLLLWSTSPNL